MNKDMKTIVISGAHSGIGKTTLAEKILRQLPNWSALKVTMKKGTDCPRHSDCTACGELTGDFDIITDKKVIDLEGTDTGRLKKAGAKDVVWLRATPEGLKRGLEKAFCHLAGSEGIIIEGTSVLRHIDPGVVIFLKDGAADLREEAREAERKADIIIDVEH